MSLLRRRILFRAMALPSGEPEVTDYTYTGAVQSVILTPGSYILECWGAQGGNRDTDYGGLGGYSKGMLTLASQTTVYIYVGGQPATNSNNRVAVSGGFNGGGAGFNRWYSGTYTYGQGGGGASDIRIGQDSLYARVIVAGGGGGSASNGDERSTKCGGGTYGGPGGCTQTDVYNAKQTAPSTSSNYKAGTFGVGAAATTSRSNYKYGSGGGGGGWYGGYAYNTAADSPDTLKGYNGGGSGYVYTPETVGNYPSGCVLDSSHYLSDAETHMGSEADYGREGNGLVRITSLNGGAVPQDTPTPSEPSNVQTELYQTSFWNTENGASGNTIDLDMASDTITFHFTGTSQKFWVYNGSTTRSYRISYDSVTWRVNGQAVSKPAKVGCYQPSGSSSASYSFTSGGTYVTAEGWLQVMQTSSSYSSGFPLDVTVTGLKITQI